MRLLSLGILGFLLGVVYWIGATVYTDRIEDDISHRTGRALEEFDGDIRDLSLDVDGRDITVKGKTSSEDIKAVAGVAADSVWGVRVTDNQIDVDQAKLFDFTASHDRSQLTMSGLVDSEEALDKLKNIHHALPPETQISLEDVEIGAEPLVKSPRKLETGIAAVTQLNPGELYIDDENFILSGIVSNEEQKHAVEQLVRTRAADLEPLRVTTNITVDTFEGVTKECREAILTSMQNNVLNYKVARYNIEPRYAAKLREITNTVLTVCKGQISKILVEGHADVTGSEGYNQGLSEHRSGAVRDFLIEGGVPAKEIIAFGYGEFRPIASNETVEGRAKNRRVEIHLLTDSADVNPEKIYQLSTVTED